MITKTAKLSRLRTRVVALGLTLEDDGLTVRVSCPAGLRLAGPQCHEVGVAYAVPAGAWRKGEAYWSLLDDLEMGAEPCPDARANGGDWCDWCDEEDASCLAR